MIIDLKQDRGFQGGGKGSKGTRQRLSSLVSFFFRLGFAFFFLAQKDGGARMMTYRLPE